MPFLKCKQCNHVDTRSRFIKQGISADITIVCPRCANTKGNIVEVGDEVDCAECLYHSWEAGSCNHPDNRVGNDFWSKPQDTCYTSRHIRQRHPTAARNSTQGRTAAVGIRS